MTKHKCMYLLKISSVLECSHAPQKKLLWCTLLIANNPIIQERLQQELDSVVPRDRLPSVNDKLPYHEATILEVMRLKTTIPLSLSHTTIRDTEVA